MKNLIGIHDGQDLIVFLGNTGSGKSTLINYLVGNHLVRDGRFFVLRDPDAPKAFPVGARGSVTRYPKLGKVGELLLCDLPGFRDKAGTVQNLVNAAFIHDIISRAGSLGLVYVARATTFGGEGRALLVDQGVDVVRKLFEGDDEVLEKHGMFVATESGCEEPADTIKEILSTLESDDSLSRVLNYWHEQNLFQHMQSPAQAGIRGAQSIQEAEGMGEAPCTSRGIVEAINQLTTFKPVRINIDALYPREDHQKLQEMFEHCMVSDWESFKNHKGQLSVIDALLAQTEKADFFDSRNRKMLDEQPHISLIRRFASSAYENAFTAFKKKHESKLTELIKLLKNERRTREGELVTKTEELADSLVNKKSLKDVFIGPFALQDLAFDFKDTLPKITDDAKEHEYMQQQLDMWFHQRSTALIQKQYIDPIAVELSNEKQKSTRAIDALMAEVRQMQTRIEAINARQTTIATIFNSHTHQSPNADGCMCRTTQHPNQII